MNLGEESKGLPKGAYYYVFAFLFLYVAMTYFGASMDLAVIISGLVIIVGFGVINIEKVRAYFTIKPSVKKEQPKVVDAELVQMEEIE